MVSRIRTATGGNADGDSLLLRRAAREGRTGSQSRNLRAGRSGRVWMPLYQSGTTVLPPNSGVDCQKVCTEYGTCVQSKGVQAGFTCDATLCTDECSDRDLMGTACSALPKCDISEIVKAEEAAQRSWCASQLCGCAPTKVTNSAIFSLNQRQRDLGITPQCDVNGTLCGTP